MKRLLSLALLGMFGLSIVGCHASVEPVDTSNGDSHYKKTTTVNNDGTSTVKTETKTDKTTY
jgi:hypothetical protein